MKMNYVVGFIFDETVQRIWLIRKNRPAWQSGMLNGIGGKIEPGETPAEAMKREALEETGYEGSWIHYAQMGNDEWNCEVFYSIKDENQQPPQTKEDEPIEMVSVHKVIGYKEKTISNLPWLISAALNRIYPGTEKDFFLTVKYTDS